MKIKTIKDLIGKKISVITDMNDGGIISRPQVITDISVDFSKVSMMQCVTIDIDLPGQLRIHGYNEDEFTELINRSCDTDSGMLIGGYMIFFN